MARRYFINLFTEETWRESRVNARFTYTGHTDKLRNRAQISSGDVFLCWVTRVSAFVAAYEIVGDSYEVDHEDPPTWRRALFPLRYPVRLLVRTPLRRGVSLQEIRQQTPDPAFWGWAFRNSGNEIGAGDAEWILNRLETTVPQLGAQDDEPELGGLEEAEGRADAPGRPKPEDRPHARIQAKLLKLGRDMGLDVYVARNDRSTVVDGMRLGDLATVERVPVGLPESVRRTVELIDVIWLRRNEYVAAFEIESTTRIFTGLLRMGDLVAQIPNLVIPLFIVASDVRRGAVFEELSRPLFTTGLQRPLDQLCRFIAFEALEADLELHGPRAGLFDPQRYLDELAESSPHRDSS